MDTNIVGVRESASGGVVIFRKEKEPFNFKKLIPKVSTRRQKRLMK